MASLSYLVAIDPGARGAIATYVVRSRSVVWYPMPDTHREILRLLQSYHGDAYAWLEDCRARPGQGVCSMFTFGQHLGALKMALLASNIPFRLITPSWWTHQLGILGKKKDKLSAVRFAERTYPSVDAPRDVADALCMLELMRRQGVGLQEGA